MCRVSSGTLGYGMGGLDRKTMVWPAQTDRPSRKTNRQGKMTDRQRGEADRQTDEADRYTDEAGEADTQSRQTDNPETPEANSHTQQMSHPIHQVALQSLLTTTHTRRLGSYQHASLSQELLHYRSVSPRQRIACIAFLLVPQCCSASNQAFSFGHQSSAQ